MNRIPLRWLLLLNLFISAAYAAIQSPSFHWRIEGGAEYRLQREDGLWAFRKQENGRKTVFRDRQVELENLYFRIQDRVRARKPSACAKTASVLQVSGFQSFTLNLCAHSARDEAFGDYVKDQLDRVLSPGDSK
jgi:hypothetical protein